MKESAIVEFKNLNKGESVEIEIPLDITANDLVFALNETYQLGMNTDDVFSCYLVAENPICFLKGNKPLKQLGIRNGSFIIFKRD